MKEKDIEIVWNDKPCKVKIRGLTWKETNKIRKGCMTTKIIGNRNQLEFDSVTMTEKVVETGLVSTPDGVKKDEFLNSIDNEAGEKLISEIQELSKLTPKKLEGLGGVGNMEQQIQNSKNTS